MRDIRAFAESLNPDLGPMFGRDVVRLCDSWLAQGRVIEAERAQREWAFEQLRMWWRGVSRDTSDPAAAIAELDRVEATLAVLSACPANPKEPGR